MTRPTDADPSPVVAVDEAAERERPALASLLQLYLYDFTDLMPWDVDERGRCAPAG